MLGGGKMKPILDGALGEIASDVLGGFGGPLGQAAGYGIVGIMRNNSTLKTLAGMQLGNMASGMLPFGGGGSGGGGFFQS